MLVEPARSVTAGTGHKKSRQDVFIIEIIATALVAIVTTVLAVNCTATMSISKYNTSSPQQIEQTTNVDSTRFNVNLK